MKEYIVRIEHGADGAVHYFRTGGEIVRCKDCIYYNRGELWGRSWNFCDYSENFYEDSDYCSHGERRTDETD